MVFTLSKCHNLGKLELVSSTNTEKRYICPVCNQRSLKEKKVNNAYLCYNYCSTADIRAKLGYETNDGNGEYRAPISSNYVKPVSITSLEPPITVGEYNAAVSRQLGSRTLTNFSYSDSCVVERVDHSSSDKKKEFFPKFKSGNQWVYGGSSKFGLFNARYIKSRGSILICEGEKTADLITKVTSYLTLSPPAFGWKEDYISSNLFNPKITGVVYLPDNDDPGKKKSTIVRDACWIVGIPCLIYSYTTYIRDGGDFVDLHDDGIDIKQLIENIYDKFRIGV